MFPIKCHICNQELVNESRNKYIICPYLLTPHLKIDNFELEGNFRSFFCDVPLDKNLYRIRFFNPEVDLLKYDVSFETLNKISTIDFDPELNFSNFSNQKLISIVEKILLLNTFK